MVVVTPLSSSSVVTTAALFLLSSASYQRRDCFEKNQGSDVLRCNSSRIVGRNYAHQKDKGIKSYRVMEKVPVDDDDCPLAIAEDVSSLVSIEMEGSILKWLMDLFLEYSITLERALTNETQNIEKSGSSINLAESLEQQVSIIANLSTLVHFLSGIIRNVFKDKDYLKIEIDRYILTAENTCSRARSHFCKQFIHEIMFLEDSQRLNVASRIDEEGDSRVLPDLAPSVPYQMGNLVTTLDDDVADGIMEVSNDEYCYNDFADYNDDYSYDDFDFDHNYDYDHDYVYEDYISNSDFYYDDHDYVYYDYDNDYD